MLDWIDRKENVGIGIVVFAMLLWLWPNLVHEPLHLLALMMQGQSGTIHFNFTFPAHPQITAASFGTLSTFGRLFYFTFPSIISVAILLILYIEDRKPTLITHIILPVYLTFDLVVNIVKFNIPTSDFRFFQTAPMLAYIVAAAVMVLGAAIIVNAIQDEVHEHGTQKAMA